MSHENKSYFDCYRQAEAHHEEVGGWLIGEGSGFSVLIDDTMELWQRYPDKVWAAAGWDETKITEGAS